MNLKEDGGDLTRMQNITSSLLNGLIGSLEFHRRNMIYDFSLRPVGHAVALIIRARERECECPLRVKSDSAYAGSNYQAIY